ncbi:ribosomal protein S18-alanine N-acetyltransferase [Nitrospira sp. CMX1]
MIALRGGRTMLDLHILPATPDRLPEIVLLEEACFSAPWTRKMLEAELTGNPFAHFLVALRQDPSRREAESEILGYHCFWIVFEELRLMNVAVRGSMRRQGVGRALVMEACRLGVEQAATRAILEVRASNEAARSLYTQLGFVQVGKRPQYYTHPTEDALLMEMNPLVLPGSWQPDRTCRTGGAPLLPDSL